MGKCACVVYGTIALVRTLNKHRLSSSLISLTKWLNFFNADNHKFPQNEWQFPGLSLYHLTLQLYAIHWATLAQTLDWSGSVFFFLLAKNICVSFYLLVLSLASSIPRFLRFGVNANWKIGINPVGTLPLLNHHHRHRSASFRLEWRRDESNSSNQALYLNISSSLPSI